MSCHETSRLLDAYVDGELDLTAALAVEDHVESCARCKLALAKLRALRSAVRRHARMETAPDSLRARLQARYAPQERRPGMSWGWGLAVAAPGIAALALSAWLGLAAPDMPRTAGSPPSTRVVYHIASGDTARAALRNLANHLNASPHVKIVVVAHNDGVDFLLRGARDSSGQPFEPAVNRFLERGVEFRVCKNTLERRQIDASQVLPAASLVPSGIAEISRLQSQEGYAYMRL